MALNKTVKEFGNEIRATLNKGEFIKMTISKAVEKSQNTKNIFIRLIKIKGETGLSFTYRYSDRDVVKNYSKEKGIELILTILGNNFLCADLFSLTKDIHLKYNKKRIPKIFSTKASFTATESTEHDIAKKRIIKADKNNIYLKSLGITDQRGEVVKSMNDKYKQINKFVEIIASELKSGNMPEKLNVVDMGAGKGYLTFAVYDYLNNILKIPTNVKGIEVRDKLVKYCNKVAEKSSFYKLKFEQGTISDFDAKGADIVIALHACDTATDDVLHKAIEAGTSTVIVAPCCYKHLRKQLKCKNELTELLKFGILAERQAEIITDTIRALILEANGYKTKVFEFISAENTPKNIMIIATKTNGLRNKAEIMKKINAIKEIYGIEYQYLEKLMTSAENDSSEWRNENPVCKIK